MKNDILDLWVNFKKNIKHNNRFFVGNEIVSILDKIKSTDDPNISKNDSKLIENTSNRTMILYRARLGNFKDSDERELLAPPIWKTKAGRCYPLGISYLYLSSDIETAIQEARPVVGQFLTVAAIRVPINNLFYFQIQDKEYKRLINDKDADLLELINIINKDLSKPIVYNKELKYLPYEFLAEYIKKRGFRGFAYNSSVTNEGINYVIFNYEHCNVISKKLYNIKRLTIDYEEI